MFYELKNWVLNMPTLRLTFKDVILKIYLVGLVTRVCRLSPQALHVTDHCGGSVSFHYSLTHSDKRNDQTDCWTAIVVTTLNPEP